MQPSVSTSYRGLDPNHRSVPAAWAHRQKLHSPWLEPSRYPSCIDDGHERQRPGSATTVKTHSALTHLFHLCRYGLGCSSMSSHGRVTHGFPVHFMFFTQGVFPEFLQMIGVGSVVTAPEAHHQNGVAESLIGACKRTMRRLRNEDPNLSPSTVGHLTAFAHNHSDDILQFSGHMVGIRIPGKIRPILYLQTREASLVLIPFQSFRRNAIWLNRLV